MKLVLLDLLSVGTSQARSRLSPCSGVSEDEIERELAERGGKRKES